MMMKTSLPIVFIASLLSVSLLIPGRACGGERQPHNLPSLAAHFNVRSNADLDTMVTRKYIRVLSTYNMTNFFIFRGELHGFEYSLLKEYEAFLNRGREKSEIRVVLEFLTVSRERLLHMLREGFGDIAAGGLTATPEHYDGIGFTDPHLTGVDEVVVAHESVRGLGMVEDLSGRTVFVRKNSSYYESLVSLNERLREKNLDPIEIIEADETLETEEILEMVNSGVIEITIADSHIAEIWSNILKKIRMYRSLKVRTDGIIALMVRKDNPGLKESLNRFLRTHKKGTLKGNIYFNRYYKDTKWIKNPLCRKDCEKIRTYIDLFKKYGRRYSIDWMLVMAMAYQESGLEQDIMSPAGAVGLMQVRRPTAGDKNVAIKNIDSVEDNIHAGVKYLAFLKRRYFDSMDLKERDKIRFALASYNAGPAKILRARKLAATMGLDANRWFRNVEVAVLKSIGREPVRYVSNINKYYIVYKLGLMEDRIVGNVSAGRKGNPQHYAR